MKTNIFKKVFACVLALSMMAIPSLSLASTGTTLYDFDFANVPDGTYNITTIQSAQGVDLSGVTLAQDSHVANYIVENDLGKFTGSDTTGGGLWQNLTFNQAVTDGVVTFDVVFDKSASRTISNKDTTLFNIWSGSNEFNALTLDGPSGTNNPNVLFVGTDANRTTFKNGLTYLSKDGVHNLRIVVMRENDQTDWTFKLYDMDVSSTQEILETTLPQANFPSITKVSSGVYIGGSVNGTTPVIAFKKLSASTMSYADANRVTVELPSTNVVGVASPSLTVNFSGAIDPATLSNITFVGEDGVNRASVAAGAGNTSAILTLSGLTDGETYTLTVPATVTDASGNAVTPASKQITAEADLDAFYSFDFANVPNGTYDINTIQTAQGVYLNGATLTQGNNPSTYNVAGGVGTLTGSAQAVGGGRIQQNLAFKSAIESGAYVFDVAFNAEGTKNLGNSSISILRLKSATNEFGAITLSPAGSSTAPGPIIVGDGHLSGKTKYPFIDGNDTYAEDATYNLRAVIMRNSTDDDWDYKLYDMDKSSVNPILTKTLSKDEYPSITSVYLDAYLGGSYAGTTTAIAFTKYSARSVSYADLTRVNVTLPTETQVGVASPSLTVNFSGAIDPATLSNITFAAEDGVNRASVTAGAGNTSAILTMSGLTDGTTYTLTVPATVTDANGNAVTPASKQITAEADLDALYSFDFANVPTGDYTVDTIKTAQGVYLNGATLTQGNNPSTYNVAGGVGTLTGSAQAVGGGRIQQNLAFKSAIESGAVAFDVAFNKEGTKNLGNSSISILRLKSATNEFGAITLSPAGSTTSPGPIIVGDGHLTGKTKYPFIGGSETYAEDDTYNLRAVIMRNSANDDWNYRLYDLDLSSETPILTKTLSKDEYPSITSVYLDAYLGGSYAGTTTAIAFTKYSARYIDAADIDAVEAAWVTDAEGTVVQNLGTTGGNFNVVADVNTLSGKLYAAVYTNGWKLIDVKSATPSATGTTTIPFTGLTVGADSHVKLFYWNNGFQPLTSFIDPLVK